MPGRAGISHRDWRSNGAGFDVDRTGRQGEVFNGELDVDLPVAERAIGAEVACDRSAG